MTARDVNDAIARIAAQQAGVISRVQVLQVGGTRDVIRRRLGSGALTRCVDGVYRVQAYDESWLQALWIATLAPGCDAVVSHEAAAALHGLATFRPGPVVVTVPHATTRLDAIAVVHQSRRLYPEHITVADGLRATTITRTAIDLAASYRIGRMEIVVDSSLSSRKATLQEFCTTFDDLACRGRRGTKLMRHVLADRAPGYVAPASVLESLFLQLLRRNGLPRPVLQYPHPSPAMEGRRVDAAFVSWRVLVELDSRRWHDRSRDHERDNERDEEARRVGWDPHRFTYRNVTQQGDWVVAVLRDVLRLAA